MANTNPTEKLEKMQEKYADLVTDGVERREAARIVGYSDKTGLDQIEKSTSIQEKIQTAFRKKGITEDWLAQKYFEGVEATLKNGAKDKDLNALSQLLKGISYQFTGGKPQVAVQINNNTTPQAVSGDGPERLEAALREVERIRKDLAEEISRRESSGVHAGDPGVIDARPCDGVVEVVEDAQEAPHRGQS